MGDVGHYAGMAASAGVGQLVANRLRDATDRVVDRAVGRAATAAQQRVEDWLAEGGEQPIPKRRKMSVRGGLYKKPRGRGGPTIQHFMKCIEKKNNDVALSSAAITAGGDVVSLVAGILQDTKADGRVGDKIFLWDLNLNMRLVWTSSGTPGQCRVLLVVDKQGDGATPNYADGDADSVMESASILSYRKLDNTQRFNVIYDRVFQVSAGDKAFCFPKIHKSFKKGMQIKYTTADQTGANAGIRQNNVWCIIYSDSPTYVSRDFHARIRYTD